MHFSGPQSIAVGSVKGSCYCGAIRYQLNSASEFASHCHCRSCRKVSGAPMLTWTAVKAAQFELLAGYSELKNYASSAQVTWQFCGVCGSTLFYQSSQTPDKLYVTVASLDDALDRIVEGHVSFEEKPEWLDLSPSLPRFRGKSDERI